MNNIVFADGAVGLRLVQWLLANYKDDIALVVTVSENDIYACALASGVTCVCYSTDAQLVLDIAATQKKIDFGFLIWWPKIIREEIISTVASGFINTHPSLLPYNRGKNYNFWALVEGAPFGVTLHFVDTGVDSGDIVAQRPIPYTWEDTGATLFHRAQSEMVVLFQLTYPEFRSGTFKRIKQDLSKGSFHKASELEPASEVELDKTYTAKDLINLLRARTFEGFPACYFEEHGEQYEIRVSISRRIK